MVFLSFSVYWFLIVVSVQSTRGCSVPEGYKGPPSIGEKAAMAEFVLQAEVTKTYIDNAFDYGGGSQSYYAEIQPMCIFKGDHQWSVMNVSEAGIIPGKCTEIKLEVGKTYILYLQKDDANKFNHYDVIPTPADEASLETLVQYCGLKSEKVAGATSVFTCNEVASESNCKVARGGSGTLISGASSVCACLVLALDFIYATKNGLKVY